MPLDRRQFLEVGVYALSAALAGCASVAMLPVTPVNGLVRVHLRDVPHLAAPGGYLKLQPGEGRNPIYVLSLASGGYAALSPICTHLGCTVDIAGPQLVCPCHGSTYARDGTVLRGPAERALQRHQLEETAEGDLLIWV